MKDVLAAIGLFVVILLAVGVFQAASPDKQLTTDAQIKAKIELIALAESNKDPVVQAQAEIVKEELKSLQAQIQAKKLKEKQDAEQAAASKKRAAEIKASMDANPIIGALKFIAIAIFAFTMIGGILIMLRSLERS